MAGSLGPRSVVLSEPVLYDIGGISWGGYWFGGY